MDSRGLLHGSGSAELRSDQPRAQWVIVLSAGGRHLAWLSPLVPPLVLNDSIALFSLVSEGVTVSPPTLPVSLDVASLVLRQNEGKRSEGRASACILPSPTPSSD